MPEALLSIERVSKDFPVRAPGRKRGRLSAVHDVSLELFRGETLGIVGESGSGKSTLARMLVQLLSITSGEVRFDGIRLTNADRHQRLELRRRIQMIFQDPQSSLDPRMRLDAIVAEGLYHSDLSRSAKRTRVGELLELVGLGPSMMRSYPHQLSGGERQRVGIARALAAEPDLLVADEPVSALDASVQGQVLNLLKTLKAERGLSMIFVAHELPVARYMSDRVAVMQLGRVVELAPADDLFRAPAHPYTQALISAMPAYGRAAGERQVLGGDAPSPIDPAPICRFSSRCVRRLERCVTHEPLLENAVSEDHQVACFNWETSDEGDRWLHGLSNS